MPPFTRGDVGILIELFIFKFTPACVAREVTLLPCNECVGDRWFAEIFESERYSFFTKQKIPLYLLFHN